MIKIIYQKISPCACRTWSEVDQRICGCLLNALTVRICAFDATKSQLAIIILSQLSRKKGTYTNLLIFILHCPVGIEV